MHLKLTRVDGVAQGPLKIAIFIYINIKSKELLKLNKSGTS